MLRCHTEISIKANLQQGRDFEMNLNFCNEFECDDKWEDLTNQARVVFPKNVYVRDKFDNVLPLGGNTPNKLIDNLFKEGDSVTINYGYYTYDAFGNERLDMPESPVFTGYISKVKSKIPIELECEDNMWILKQSPCKPQVWTKDKTVEDLLRMLLNEVNLNNDTNFTVNALANTTIGDFVIQDESVAQLLARLQKDYNLESYFKGDELRIGFSVYVPEDVKEHKFVFQKNIISDSLEFQNKKDIKLSAVVIANNELQQGTNKKGQTKTKKDKIEILVYPDSRGEFVYKVKENGVEFPENVEGERRTLNFINIADVEELFKRGKEKLSEFYYDGFKGSFTTFAIPLVRVGDNVIIEDELLPDRNGKYKVKEVKYTGGVNGHRQEIFLHYKV